MAHVTVGPRFEGLLAEAGRLLASSLELDETLRTVTRLGIPELADWCAVVVVDPDGRRRELTSGHADARLEALLCDLRGRRREGEEQRDHTGIASVLETSEPAIFAPLAADDLPDATDEERRLWQRLHPVSWLVVPMRADGALIGALTLLSTDPARVYDDGDIPVAVELAERCARAVVNAQRYEAAESARSLLDTVFATAPVGMSVLDAELRYVLVNERLAEMNGRPVGDHLGRRVLDVLGPAGRPIDDLVRRVVETSEPVSDVELTAGGRAFLASYAPVVVEREVLGVIAAVVETTERHRAQEEIARSEAQFRALVDAAVFGVARGRRDEIRHANDAFLALVGRDRAELGAGLSWTGCTPPRWHDVDASKAHELAERGSFDPYEKEFARPDGTVVPALVAGSAIPGQDGEWIGFVVDLTERRAAEREREHVLARTSRLHAVGEGLSGALTEAEVAAVIFEQGMAATGACCGVLGLVRDRDLRVEHRFGIDGDAPGILPLDLQAPMPTAARDRAPVLLHSHAEWLERFPQVPPRSDFEAFAAVPLPFEDGVVGVMGLGFPDVRAFDDHDVDLLVAIARQGAQALERARLYEERAYVARTLQEGLLPRALPDIPGLDLAVLYRPLGDGSEVGGDFYDVVALDDDGWLVVVGDICGKGTAAAVLTGIMRSTVRALALHEDRPEMLLQRVNEALLSEGSANALATMAVATIRRDGDRFAVRCAAGGHPPPLLLRAGGDLEVVEASGPLLGVRLDPPFIAVDETLHRDDVLLLYTDGVIDDRPPGGFPFGEERLHAAVASAPERDAAGIIGAVDEAVRAHAPDAPRDDKALLAVRPTGRPAGP